MLLAFSVIGVPPVLGSAPKNDLDWKAKSIDGRVISLTEPDRLTVILFVGVECPVARHYAIPLQSSSQLFAEQPVSFIGVDSNLQDSTSEAEQLVQELKLSHPMVHDADQGIAKCWMPSAPVKLRSSGTANQKA